MRINSFRIILVFLGILCLPVFGFGLKIGDQAPEFSVTDPNGKAISLKQLRGKVVLLDFWASWCVPCREANQELVPVYHKFKNQGFEVFSVSLDSRKDPWLAAIKADKLEWSWQGCDLKGWESPIAYLYRIDILPTSYLLDENGIVIGRDLDEYDLEIKLNYVFHEQVNFYPQTVTGKLHFTAPAKYEVYDASGRKVLSGKAQEIDVSLLALGTYTLKYEGRSGQFTKRKSPSTLATFSPTRADDKVYLSRQTEYEVYNSRGKIVLKGVAAEIDVSKLTSGSIYYLNLEGTVGSFFKK
jgi:thiol-disulfide isomerase/thioredoxin